MRILVDHEILGYEYNEEIQVLDRPGFGGACHEYQIVSGNRKQTISFQNGAIKEYGINGTTQEALLTIVIDRLRSFQEGDFNCRENAIALTNCEQALMWLQKRTRDRAAPAYADRLTRGIEGRDVK